MLALAHSAAAEAGAAAGAAVCPGLSLEAQLLGQALVHHGYHPAAAAAAAALAVAAAAAAD